MLHRCGSEAVSCIFNDFMKLCISIPAVHINYKYPDTKQSMEKHWNMLLHTNINGKCRNIPWSWIRSNNINFLKLWSLQELACSIDVVLCSVVLKLWAVTCYNNMVLCTKITIKSPYISGFLCYLAICCMEILHGKSQSSTFQHIVAYIIFTRVIQKKAPATDVRNMLPLCCRQ